MLKPETLNRNRQRCLFFGGKIT